MSGEAELEFARIRRPIPMVVFSPDAEFGGRALRGWPPTTSPPRSADSVTGRVRTRCPSAGRALAAAAIAEDLIDEYRLFVNPVILGVMNRPRFYAHFLCWKDGAMSIRYDENTKARAVRLVREHRDDYESEWAAMKPISGRLGMN